MLVEERMTHVLGHLTAANGFSVMGGPFRGMQIRHIGAHLGPGLPWNDLPSKLLGTYESELHDVIASYSGQSFDAIINIGCAEGYYVNGFARMFPGSPVLAFDTSVEAQEMCRRNCRENGQGRVQISGEFTEADFAHYADKQCLWLVDIEGFEFTLFDRAIPHLTRSHLIIEAHDCANPAISERLISLFRSTHAITVIAQSARNPRGISLLDTMSDVDCWLAVCETRPSKMEWLICQPRWQNPLKRLIGRRWPKSVQSPSQAAI